MGEGCHRSFLLRQPRAAACSTFQHSSSVRHPQTYRPKPHLHLIQPLRYALTCSSKTRLELITVKSKAHHCQLVSECLDTTLPQIVPSQRCITTIHQSLHLAHPPRDSLCLIAEHKATHLPPTVRTCSHLQRDTTPTNQPCSPTNNSGNSLIPSFTSNREHNPAFRPLATSITPQQFMHPRLSTKPQKASSPNYSLTALSNVPWTRAKSFPSPTPPAASRDWFSSRWALKTGMRRA